MNFRPLLFLLFPFSASADVVVNEFMAGNSATAVPNAVAGTFEDWIELKNTGDSAIDLGGWRLTDTASEPTLWSFPQNTSIPPGGFVVVFASGQNAPDANGNLHTNFKLSKDGEYVGLIQPDGSVASSYGPGGTVYPSQTDDISYGRHPVSTDAVFFSTPTPGAENDTSGIAKVAPLQATPKRGFYQSAQTITLGTATGGTTIHYTTDGTPPLNASGAPTATAQTYSAPIAIGQTTVLRAAAVSAGHAPTDIVSHTYVLLDIDGAASNGTDPGGLNTPFLQQTQPTGYGSLSSGDYNINTAVSKSTAQSAGHGGLSISQAMLQGMRDVPTISIALPKEDFAGGGGIYSNSTQEGLAWEKACSAEFIPAKNDTRSDFQENCGLRVQGGASRNPSSSPKHSLSFRFREEYGAGRLKQALFPDSDVDNFNSIALRAGYNNSWIHSDSGQRSRGSMIRDQWMRESMHDMGHEDAGHGFLAHVFVNGLYWGLHNVAERQDNVHYAQYNGGDSDLIDALNGTNLVEGNSTAWNAMKSVVSTKNWVNIQQVLDIDTYIDFQILQRYGANQDLKTNGNWRAAGGGPFTVATEMRPWKIFSWDGERVLENVADNIVPLDPMGIRGTLETMPEYRLRFADRAKRHLTGNGALTPDRTRARWAKYADVLDKAIIAESARWGDHRRNPSYSRTEWLTEQSRLYNTYFPVRTANVIDDLVSAKLFGTVDPPELLVDGVVSEGGFVAPGSTLAATGPTGTIYYTTDGSDPLNLDGTLNPSALSIASGTAQENSFPFESAGWRFLATGDTGLSASNVVVGHASYSSTDWKHEAFNDAAWEAGVGLMAGDNANAISDISRNTAISLNGPSGRIPTVYFRKSFNVTNAHEIASITPTVIRDDGFVLYLNGKEIFRDNMDSGTISYSSFALGGADEREFPTTTYTLAPGDLKEGENVISVEVHNASLGSNDLGLDVALDLHRLVGVATIDLPTSATITARSFVDSTWSTAVRSTFLLEAAATSGNLAISEINYHPREASLLEKNTALPLVIENRDEFEFIELLNTSGSAINLVGSSFTNGLELELGFRAVAPGERVVVVRNPEAFLQRYGSNLLSSIAGTYLGGLNNAGDTLTLVDSDGAIIDSVTYSDSGSWPSRADGSGSSLERLDPTTDPNLSSNWTSSVAFHGSPGVSGELTDQRIVINEVSSNSANDFIEIYNTTASAIDISSWLLSDSKEIYRSFEFPATTINAMSYLAIDATAYDSPATNVITNYTGTSGAAPTTVTSTSHGLTTGALISIRGYGGFSAYNNSFEVTVLNDNTFTIDTPFLDNHASKGAWRTGRPFGLSAGNGDDLWLLETDGNGNPVAFVDHIEFAAADPDRTLGRWLDGEGYSTLFPMISETKAATNSGPLLGPIFLSEVHYHPSGPDNHEFVEITNQGNDTRSLDHWQLRGGVDFDFTADHSLAPGASLVLVSFDPTVATALATDFRSTFQIDNSVVLVGPFSDGPLNDDQGTIRLQKAGPAPDFDQITVDEVRYLSTTPWPIAAAGNGSSLERIPALGFGNFASSWTAATPTPGTSGGETYADWATANGVGGGNEDPDGDDYSNLLEFALGTDPKISTTQLTYSASNGTGTITFPVHTGRQGVQLFFETSVDLESWGPEATNSAGVNGKIQTREFVFSQAANPDLYWRLRAVQTP
ncbi:lamin tail domain-containing protein [Verrucomicrobiaceae bacterium 227]